MNREIWPDFFVSVEHNGKERKIKGRITHGKIKLYNEKGYSLHSRFFKNVIKKIEERRRKSHA